MVDFGNLSENNRFNPKEVYLLGGNEEDISSIGESFSSEGILLYQFDIDDIEEQEQKSMLLIKHDYFSNLDEETIKQKIKTNHFVFSYAHNAGESIVFTDGHVKLPIEPKDIKDMVTICEQKAFYEEQIEELESKNTALEKVAGLGRFTGSLVHDLNNYNTICMTAFDGIKLVNHKKIQNEKVDFLVSKGLKGCKMINSLSLKYRRFMLVDQDAEREFHNLGNLISEALDYAEKDLNQFAITYKVEVAKGIQILCNETSFIQILVNLISNSIFEIKNHKNPWISLKVRTKKTGILLYVIDSGEGIPKEIQQRIFDPLFTTKAKNEGTGFGLNFCLEELKNMGMNLQYVENQNTAFAIEIPIEKLKTS